MDARVSGIEHASSSADEHALLLLTAESGVLNDAICCAISCIHQAGASHSVWYYSI